jgi:hypothetical protein
MASSAPTNPARGASAIHCLDFFTTSAQGLQVARGLRATEAHQVRGKKAVVVAQRVELVLPHGSLQRETVDGDDGLVPDPGVQVADWTTFKVHGADGDGRVAAALLGGPAAGTGVRRRVVGILFAGHLRTDALAVVGWAAEVSTLLGRARRHAFGARELPTVPRVLGPATALDIVTLDLLAHAPSGSGPGGRPGGEARDLAAQLPRGPWRAHPAFA